MKIQFIKYMVFAMVFIIPFSSCEDYLDVNVDPNRVTDVTLAALLPTTIEATSTAHFNAARLTCEISQQLGSYFDYPEILSLNSTWTEVYLRSLGNLGKIVTDAGTSASPHYAGVAKVLQALNLGILTDNWEAVPYSEGNLGSDNFTPVYDNQEKNYNTINSLLNAAINDLQAAESVFQPGSDDLAYGGDIERWLKLAYTLKARYAIHLTNKDAIKNATDALTAIDNGFTDNGDDFQLNYNSVNKNPWHLVALANNTGNLTRTMGSYLIDLMKNTAADCDPRMFAITDNGLDCGDIFGITSYDEDATASNVDFTVNTWHSTESAPILMVTFAEAKFIEAEAAMITGNSQRAYDAYLAGIAANMEKLGVDGSAYMADANVAVGMGGLTLSHIMKEKYVATYLNTESWVDVRRHHYDATIYTNFVEADPFDIGGSFQRVRYPEDEFSRNGTQAMANDKDLTVTMWRDQ